MGEYKKYILYNLKCLYYYVLSRLPFLNKEKYNKRLNRYLYKLSKVSHSILTYGEETALKVERTNVGRHTYICYYVVIASEKTEIGSFVSVADNVTIGTTHHPTNYLSTHPFCYYKPAALAPNSKQAEFEYNTPCKIGNDVWIGKAAIIMDGITVGDGAIIGANAVVTHDVPPYAIVAGVPARILKYRFDEDTIKDLLELKWWELDEEIIADLPFNDIHGCIKKLKEIRSNI